MIPSAHKNDDDPDDDIVADHFINTTFDDADYIMDRVEEASYKHDEAGHDPDPAAMKPACSTRLFTAS